VARILGFSAEQLAALQNPHVALPDTLFKPRQRLIARFVEELNAGSRASPETMAEMRHTFSDEEIMELFYVVGVYSFLARMMNSCRIDFDQPIPGLMGMLEKYNAEAIEKEKSYED
jgi:alkylhydroperoxidase family enzyme